MGHRYRAREAAPAFAPPRFPRTLRRCEGVERRTARPPAARLGPDGLRRAAPRGLTRKARRRPALHLCGDFCPRRRASRRALGAGLSALPPGAASAARRAHHVQPIEGQPVVVPADGWPGPPGASGYKPQQRAPPPPHARQCPAERPSRGVVGDRYSIL
jgi:hypothetical protein